MFDCQMDTRPCWKRRSNRCNTLFSLSSCYQSPYRCVDFECGLYHQAEIHSLCFESHSTQDEKHQIHVSPSLHSWYSGRQLLVTRSVRGLSQREHSGNDVALNSWKLICCQTTPFGWRLLWQRTHQLRLRPEYLRGWRICWCKLIILYVVPAVCQRLIFKSFGWKNSTLFSKRGVSRLLYPMGRKTILHLNSSLPSSQSSLPSHCSSICRHMPSWQVNSESVQPVKEMFLSYDVDSAEHSFESL